jgi:CRISPR-associated protein Csb1
MNHMPNSPRLLIEAQLKPAQGHRFQPTGFPDLGAATYKAPDGTQMLLLESAQSVANRLESVCWDDGQDTLRAPLAGLPFVRVIDASGEPLTNSILEAHRLNAPYIAKAKGFDAIQAAVGYTKNRPFNRRALATALLRYDPNSLIHGIFLEKIAGVIRLPRMLSGFIEAQGVQIVSSGGVKNDRVSASGDKAAKKSAAEGYGNVPFHRDEYTARAITAYFNLDLTQLRSFGFDAATEHLLYTLSLWKIQTFLSEGLRLRTACDLDPIQVQATKPGDYQLPTLTELQASLPDAIRAVARAGHFAGPSETVLTYGNP